MPGQPTPPLIVQPFGANADPEHIQLPIPANPTGEGRASFDEGFPAVTMQPVVAGGVPPFGQDFNGILYMITSHVAALQAGQPYKFSAPLAAAIGGYAKGSILGMADDTGLWINQVTGNATNPDAGGAGWIGMYHYGHAAVVTAGGVVNLTAAQARASTIVVSGALVANAQLVFPNTLQDWLIVNLTTGGFTLTVKTAAGTGVAVSPGGYASPTQVYGNGTNIYPRVAPFTIPGDVAPTPNTYALRSNVGYLYATYFNQSAGLENATTAGAIFVEASSQDGFLRKMSPTSLQAQMNVGAFGGTLTNVQVPYGVVGQWAGVLFSSPAFTGVPTAPTAAPGTSTTQVATTAFANPGQSLTNDGYCRLPGGLVIQWGTATAASNGDMTVVYPVPYTSFSRPVVSGNNNIADQDNGPGVFSAGTASFVVRNSQDHTIPFWWIAVGY